MGGGGGGGGGLEKDGSSRSSSNAHHVLATGIPKPGLSAWPEIPFAVPKAVVGGAGPSFWKRKRRHAARDDSDRSEIESTAEAQSSRHLGEAKAAAQTRRELSEPSWRSSPATSKCPACFQGIRSTLYKKRLGIYHGTPGFTKNDLKIAGILSRG